MGWDRIAAQIVGELGHLSDRALREARLVEALSVLTPSEAVEVLNALVAGSQAGEPGHREVKLLLVGLERYEEQLGYRFLSSVYSLAAERSYDGVKALIRTRQVQAELTGDYPDNDYLSETLGERKSLAATSRDRNVLDRLLFDRNPDVITVLLRNPRVTERDVVRISAMRPTAAEALMSVVRSHTWIRRPRVRKAIVSNPHTPVNVTVSLLEYLSVGELKEVAADGALAEDVRKRARERLDDDPVLK